MRYAPNDRLNVALLESYYVTQDQDDDIKGLKNELGTKVTWALGDGDVDFALGDGLGDVIDGVFFCGSPPGWESDGMWVGNYTDPRVGFGSIGQAQCSLRGRPSFLRAGSYSGLSQRTDFAGAFLIPG